MTTDFSDGQAASGFASARRLMVLGQLRPEGVADALVLEAMSNVPRQAHLPADMAALAYADRPLTLGDGAVMFSPVDLGRLLDAAAPLASERALVIGAGGAYSAAVLEAMGLSVDRVDSIDSAAGSYDLVLVEGALAALPPRLSALLARKGRLVAAIRDRGVARLCIATADKAGLAVRSFADSHAPLMAGSAPAPAFTF